MVILANLVSFYLSGNKLAFIIVIYICPILLLSLSYGAILITINITIITYIIIAIMGIINA